MSTPELQARVPKDLEICPKFGQGLIIQGEFVFERSGSYIGPKPDMEKIRLGDADAADQIRKASLALKESMPPQESEEGEESKNSEKQSIDEEKQNFKGMSYEKLKETRFVPEPKETVIGKPTPLGEYRKKRKYERKKARGILDAPTV